MTKETVNHLMSEGEFIEWLKLRGVSEKDCRTLTGIYGYIPSIAVCNYLMKKNSKTTVFVNSIKQIMVSLPLDSHC